jgi:hypothetical protein
LKQQTEFFVYYLNTQESLDKNEIQDEVKKVIRSVPKKNEKSGRIAGSLNYA